MDIAQFLSLNGDILSSTDVRKIRCDLFLIRVLYRPNDAVSTEKIPIPVNEC
jgi:hypothetical protein